MEIRTGEWFHFPRKKMDFSVAGVPEETAVSDIAELFAYQELQRMGYEVYGGGITINRESYQKRHLVQYEKKFGEVWKNLMTLDKRAREMGLRNFHADYLAFKEKEALLVEVAANGRKLVSSVEAYLEMSTEHGFVPRVFRVGIQKRRRRFCVGSFSMEDFAMQERTSQE